MDTFAVQRYLNEKKHGLKLALQYLSQLYWIDPICT